MYYIYKETILDYLFLFSVSEISQTNDVVYLCGRYFIHTGCCSSNCGDRFIISGQKKRRNKHQICIISSLCFTELNDTLTIIITHISYRNVSPLAKHIFWFYLYSFVRLTYHSTMKLLTIDRLLVFHLNMTYLILWPSERLLKSLKVVYLISFLSYTAIFLLFSCFFSSQQTGIIFPILCSPDTSFGMSYILYKLLLHIATFSSNTRNAKNSLIAIKLNQT